MGCAPPINHMQFETFTKDRLLSCQASQYGNIGSTLGENCSGQIYYVTLPAKPAVPKLPNRVTGAFKPPDMVRTHR